MEATVQATATPAAAPPAAANDTVADVPITAGTHGLDAVLGDLTGDDAANDTEQEAAPAGEAAETTEQAQPEAGGKKGAPDELIFSDEQLATPEGIRRGRDRVKELRKMQHEKYLELKGFEKYVIGKKAKLKTSVDAFKNQKAAFEWERNTFRSNIQGLRSHDPETIINALGAMTNMDGLKAYELITSHIVNKGPPKLDPQIQAIIDEQKREIAELKNGFAQREHAEKRQHVERQISAHEQRIGEMIRASTTTPHLTRVFNDDPERLTKFLVDAITETNGAKPAHQLFAEMEQELQQHFGAVHPSGVSGGTAPKQPATAQRSPGQSVGPRTAAASNPRVPSEEESLRALANDPDFLSSLGL